VQQVIADRFVVERVVGAGGMGEVFLAIDRTSRRPVALKMMYGALARDAERFKREAQLLAGIAHPRIVKYVAHGVTETGRPYLAMEWLEGEDLADRLERQGLTLEETLDVARRTAEALAVLHERGIVHRDVKPSNLFLVDRDVSQVKLLDLGVARLLRATRPSTYSGAMVGTPGYMAPEQARGAKEVDARADVFSLGCLLYECITGRPAFVAENIAGLLAKILLESPPSLADLGVTLPPAAEDLLTRSLAKSPAARPANGAAVLKELEQLTFCGGAPPRTSAPVPRAITAVERRLVCVVMASLRGSVPEGLADLETVNATEAVTLSFDPRAVVAAFGADAEVLADGSIVVPLFGSGRATDQAAMAARCALALSSHLLGEAVVALATGLATVRGRSPVGDVIERVSALLASAKSHPVMGEETRSGKSPIILDETTAGLLDQSFDVGGDARGLFIRGLRVRETSARTLLGRPTSFVGREREIATILGIHDECVEESVSRAVLITGSAGQGKSRLATEIVGRLRQEGRSEILIARADVMSEGSPFALVARLLLRSAGLSGGEPLVVKQQRLRARIARNLPRADVARVCEFLGEISGVPLAIGEGVQLRAARQDALLMGDQTRRAFCELIAAETRGAPLVLVLEDLHWGDLPSVNLVDAALRSAADQSLLVLAVARPEVHEAFPQLWAQRNVQEIRLGPLLKRAGERLVRDVLGDGIDPADVALLLDRAEGNPFYLEELVRAYAEDAGRAPRRATPAPASPGPAWALPSTLLAMVEARLAQLDPAARRILRAASLFGERFWRGGVLALVGEHRSSEVDDWLAELGRLEIVQRRDTSRFPDEQELGFRHALVRDAAYHMLTPEDQSLGHRLAAEWLDRAGERDPMVLGEHFERGGVRERASAFYARAAAQALEGNDFALARERAARAVEAGATGVDYGKLQLILAEASRWSGDHAAARDHARAALCALGPGEGPWYVAAAEATEAAMTLGDVGEAREVAQRLSALGGASARDATARVVATSRIAMAIAPAGLYDLAAELLASIEHDADALSRDPAARAFFLAATVARANWQGDLARASTLAIEAVESFEILGDVRNATRQRRAAGTALLELGAYRSAELLLREACEAAERLGLMAVVNEAKLRLGHVFARTGRSAEAVRMTEEVIAGFASQRDRASEGYARGYLAGVHYFDDDVEAAEAEALRSAPLVEHAPPYRAAILAFLALTMIRRGASPERVREAGEGAMRAFERMGNVGDSEALVRLAYAEALFAFGDAEGARRAIRAARDRLLERASKIEDPEHARSFLEVVRENVRTLARADEWLR
jgi:tetratricopeptide (TPR) repeat protein